MRSQAKDWEENIIVERSTMIAAGDSTLDVPSFSWRSALQACFVHLTNAEPGVLYTVMFGTRIDGFGSSQLSMEFLQSS